MCEPLKLIISHRNQNESIDSRSFAMALSSMTFDNYRSRKGEIYKKKTTKSTGNETNRLRIKMAHQ